MGPGTRAGLAVLLLFLCGGPAVSGDTLETEAHVVLKSGKVLAGRVTATEKIDGKAVLVIETDFGEMRVPKPQVKKAVKAGTDPNATQRLSRLRVVRIVGTVDRHPAGAEAWQPVSWADRYEGRIANVDNAIVEPGDTIRTGDDGTLDFMATQDVWIRVGKNSEIEIPGRPAGTADAPSVALKRGRALLDIRPRARGRTFRLRTPLQTLSMRDAVARIESDELTERVAVDTGSVGTGDTAIRAGRAQETTPRGSTKRDLTDTDRYGFRERRWRLPEEDLVMVTAGTYRLAGLGPRTGDAVMHYSSFGSEIQQKVDGFLMDRLEVTNADFAEFVGATRATPPAYFANGTAPEGDGLRPVFKLAVEQVEGYCAWRGAKLPTEVQWETAARGAKARLFPWGNTWDPKQHDPLLGEYRGAAPLDPLPEVGSKIDVSPFGVENMVSGVAEWTRNHPCDPPFGPIDDHMPGLASDYRPQPDIPFRVLRGVYGSTRFRSNHRLETGIVNAGFRCVIELGD